MSTNDTDVSKIIDSYAQSQAKETVPVENMEDAIGKHLGEHIEPTVNNKVQGAILEAVDSQQVKKNSTKATLDIMKDDE